MRTENYYYKEIRYVITYLTDAEFKETISRKTGDKYSSIRRYFTRGFMTKHGTNYNIYIKDSAKIGREKLILHEIGHVLGKKHTWLPTLMNPTWVFRWIKWM